MRAIVRTVSAGSWPMAVSPESMSASVPSNTALATSEASARVGRGLRIIEVAESSPHLVHPPEPPTSGLSVARVVAKVAVQAAADAHAKAIVVFSISGSSVQLVSKFRPAVPIVGLTPREGALRRFALLWGTDGELVPEKDHSRDLITAADDVCLRGGYGEKGDAVVIVSGTPGGHGGTNRLLVHRLGTAFVD